MSYLFLIKVLFILTKNVNDNDQDAIPNFSRQVGEKNDTRN